MNKLERCQINAALMFLNDLVNDEIHCTELRDEITTRSNP